MGELSPVIEGHVKYREGKKWKPRYARIIRLSPVADSLTLQLWRDGREAERGVPSTKGSVNLNDYIGAEVGFNLDKEANTIALIFREMIHILALDDRETLMKWQVRLGHQLEEGQQFPVHLVTAPKKARLGPGPMRIHLQNLRFSLTQGVPPALINTWTSWTSDVTVRWRVGVSVSRAAPGAGRARASMSSGQTIPRTSRSHSTSPPKPGSRTRSERHPLGSQCPPLRV